MTLINIAVVVYNGKSLGSGVCVGGEEDCVLVLGLYSLIAVTANLEISVVEVKLECREDERNRTGIPVLQRGINQSAHTRE